MPSLESLTLPPHVNEASAPGDILHGDEPPSQAEISALYLMAGEAFDFVYGPEDRAEISSRLKISDRLVTQQEYAATSEIWPDVEVLFSGWGMVPMDDAFFKRMPKLKAVFYAAGTVRSFVTDTFWERKIRLINAAAANAVPVSEFTISQILFALKHGWHQALQVRKNGRFPDLSLFPGAYKTTVGLISLGLIGKMVAERLRHYDMNVVAYDPFFSPEEAKRLNVKLLSLEEVFVTSDVVSCHSPLLKETEGMIRGRHFELMKPGATFINTARGAVINEGEMIAVLQKRPDLFASLDVTDPLPPVEGSPLYTMDNVMLTPHIAGSLGNECRRMGRLMLQELDRYLAGEPLLHEVNLERFQSMA